MNRPEPAAAVEWYRSNEPVRNVSPGSRVVRDWLRSLLPEPRVRGRTIVLYNRRGFRKVAAWPGLFSEFHSVLGALKYAEDRGAAGVRIDYTSPNYLDPPHGPNWWAYFFDRAAMSIDGRADAEGETHLDGAFAQYGRYRGFCDLVNGATPHLYPMTYGLSRRVLHRLIATYLHVRPEILEKVAAFAQTRLAGSFTMGVHYRGTDSARRHFPYYRIPYDAYVAEARRCLEQHAPGSYRVFVATDEIEFLDTMEREFGAAVVSWHESPRTHPASLPIHFDAALPVSNYQKGESALIDCLLLAETSYLVKGRSNLSDASIAFNPNLPYSFCCW